MATIVIDNFPDGAYHHAKMVNYSKSGLGMGTNVAFQPGRKIVLAIENSPFPSCPGVYGATVKWCRKMMDYYALYTYAVGVHLIPFKHSESVESPGENFTDSRSSKPLLIASGKLRQSVSKLSANPVSPARPNSPIDIELPPLESRKHARKPCILPALYNFSEGIHWAFAQNISRGGMYLKKFLTNQDAFGVGQPLVVAFPSNRKNRTVRIHGEIAWIDEKGYGVRFKGLAK